MTYTYHAKFCTYLACHVIFVYTNLHGESVCIFSFSFIWPHTNVFDRVNVNRVGFGKEKNKSTCHPSHHIIFY